MQCVSDHLSGRKLVCEPDAQGIVAGDMLSGRLTAEALIRLILLFG